MKTLQATHITDNPDGTKTIWHGCYGGTTRYKVERVFYAGSNNESIDVGYVEIVKVYGLELFPVFVAHLYSSVDGHFYRSTSTEEAAHKILKKVYKERRTGIQSMEKGVPPFYETCE